MCVFLVSHKEVFRKGIACLLGKWKSGIQIHEFCSIQDLSNKKKADTPQLLIFDLDAPSDEMITRLQAFKDRYPQSRIISICTDINDRILHFLTSFMVDAHLLMDVRQDEFVLALDTVLLGKPYYDQRLTHALLQRGDFIQRNSEQLAGMTQRQQQILQLMCEEHTNKEIAEKLGISSRTVDGHRFRLIKRFGVKNTAGLIRHVVERGLI